MSNPPFEGEFRFGAPVPGPVCVYSARLLWQRWPWCLCLHRKRLGRSRFWVAWLSFRRGIHTNVVLRGDS